MKSVESIAKEIQARQSPIESQIIVTAKLKSATSTSNAGVENVMTLFGCSNRVKIRTRDFVSCETRAD